MTDIETRLRSTLRERAGDIEALPARFADLTGLTDLTSATSAGADADSPSAQLIRSAPAGHQRERSRRRATAWVSAAATVTALSIGAHVLADRHDSNRSSVGSRTASPTPSPSTPAVLPSSHAPRHVSTSSFGLTVPEGWRLLSRRSEIGYRVIDVREKTDQGAPKGCNGCGNPPPLAELVVLNKGAFDASKYGVGGWSTAEVNGTRVRIGSMRGWAYPTDAVPTLAWRFAPDRWALVQGLTSAASSENTLLLLARAMRPAADLPIGLPFRLGYVPSLPITEIDDSRPVGYSLTITFGGKLGRQFSLSLTDRRSLTGSSLDTRAAARRTVDGLPGYLDTGNGDAGVVYASGALTLGLVNFGSAYDTTVTTRDRRDLTLVLDGLQWANHDGRAPLIPFGQSIP